MLSKHCITTLSVSWLADDYRFNLQVKRQAKGLKMAKNSKSEKLEPLFDAPAHFVPLVVIINEYSGALERYMDENVTNDVVVTMPVSVDVADKGKRKFFVAVAVTTCFQGPEALSDEIERSVPKGHISLFAWVPANLYNTSAFGIFIDEVPIGEVLKNSLVNEVLEKASIEKTVIALGQKFR